jgi:cytochrome c biogenesis protein CcmG, thiol:disulfide interchange protein DsbE
VRRSAVPIVVAVLGAALVSLLVYGVVARRDDTSLDSAVKKGQLPTAPGSSVSLPTLDGSTRQSLAALRGKVVVLNFWASWCPPCQFETPTIRAMDERYRDRGLVIVAVQVQQTVQAGRDYVDRYGLKYRIGADVTGAIFHTYHVFALPTQFFIDSNGVLRQIVNGPLSDTRAAQLVESILPPGASAPASTSAAPSSSAP